MGTTRALHIVAAVLALGILVVVTSLIPEIQLTSESPEGAWFTVVHIFSNSYHTWRFDHLSRLADFGNALLSPLTAQLAILVVGMATLHRRVSPELAARPFTMWSAALVGALSVPAIIGRDIVSVGTIAWLPLLIFFLTGAVTVVRSGLERGAAPLFIILLAVSMEAATSANQTAPLIALIALIVAIKLADTDDATVCGRGMSTFLVVALLFVPALVSMASAPAPYTPDYPALSHIVPDDGIEGVPMNLVGHDFTVAIIDRAQLTRIFPLPTAILALACILSALISRVWLRPTARVIGIAGALCIISAALDQLLPESLAAIAPAASLSRIIPWGNGFSLLPTAIALGVVLSTCAFVASRNTTALSIWLAGIATAASTTGLMSPKPGVDTEFARIAIERLKAADLDTKRFIVSPSLAVARHFYPSFTLFSEKEATDALASASALVSLPEGTEIRASNEPPSRAFLRLTDGKPGSRWSTKSKQEGGEWISIELPQPIDLTAIELATGEFGFDFPRGIQFSAGATCDQRELSVIGAFPSWQGALLLTSDGFPYFSGQDSVITTFAPPRRVRCIVVTQLGQSVFDWSVAEVRISGISH